MLNTNNLAVARYARKLTVLTYRATTRFPRSEIFGLTSQIRRAAVSIGSNIAEGCGHSTKKQLLHSLDQAAGEASELEYQCLVAIDLGYGRRNELALLHRETERIKKMLAGLMTAINNGPAKNKKRSSVGGASPLEPRTDEPTEDRRPTTDDRRPITRGNSPTLALSTHAAAWTAPSP